MTGNKRLPSLTDYLLPSRVGNGIQDWAIDVEIKGRQYVFVAHSQGLSTLRIDAVNEVFFAILLRQFFKNFHIPQFTHPKEPGACVPIDQQFCRLLGNLDFGYRYSLDKALEFLSNIRFEVFTSPTSKHHNSESIKIVEFKLGQTVKDTTGNRYFKLNPEIACPVQIHYFGPLETSFHSSLRSPLTRRLYRYISYIDMIDMGNLQHLPKDFHCHESDLEKSLGFYTKRFSQIYKEGQTKTVYKLHHLQSSHLRQLLRIAENELMNVSFISHPVFNQSRGDFDSITYPLREEYRYDLSCSVSDMSTLIT